MKWPQTKDEWIALGKSLAWLFGKWHALTFVAGIVLSMLAQYLTGFWEFRENHNKLVVSQYQAVLAADQNFEKQLTTYNTMLNGAQISTAAYSTDAQNYIVSLRAVSQLLPSTKESLNNYIDALGALNKYYSAQRPAYGSKDWSIFYGNFRLAYNRYTLSKIKYMEDVSSEVGDYSRYIVNS